MTEKIIDGANIEYAPGRVMECRALVIDESGEKFSSANLLDFFDEETATQKALTISRLATQKILASRGAKIEGVLPFPEVEPFTLARVYDFVCGKLGMEPVGRLAYVKSIPERRDVAGLTDHQLRTARVSDERINAYASDESLEPAQVFMNTVFDAIRTQGVAVHELTHLAGAQDVAYVLLDRNTGKILRTVTPGTTLQPWPRSGGRGSYLEEGMATLTQSMYMWFDLDDPEFLNERKERFETFRSPSGRTMHIPTRIANPGTDHHEYTNCAWGVERLAMLAPNAWDIMAFSRRYGARSHPIRHLLRQCIDAEVPELFGKIENADIDNIEETMEVTERIDFAARRKES